MLKYKTDRTWFSRLLWHMVRKWSKILTTPEPTRGKQTTAFRTRSTVSRALYSSDSSIVSRVLSRFICINLQFTCLQISSFIFLRSPETACRHSVLETFSAFSLSNSDWSFSHSRITTVFYTNVSFKTALTHESRLDPSHHFSYTMRWYRIASTLYGTSVFTTVLTSTYTHMVISLFMLCMQCRPGVGLLVVTILTGA